MVTTSLLPVGEKTCGRTAISGGGTPFLLNLISELLCQLTWKVRLYSCMC